MFHMPALPRNVWYFGLSLRTARQRPFDPASFPGTGLCVLYAQPCRGPYARDTGAVGGQARTPDSGFDRPRPEEQRFPPPLSPLDIVRLHEGARRVQASQFTAPMARELGRQHALQYRTVVFLEYVAQWIDAGRQIRDDAARAAEILRSEPGVRLIIERQAANERRRWP